MNIVLRKITVLIFLGSLIVFPFTAFSATAPKTVFVTITPYAYFVERVGGDKVQVEVMIPSGANPHTYEVTPRQLTALARADLYIKVGAPIEFEVQWLDRLLAVNRSIPVCNSAEGISLLAMAAHQEDDAHADQPHEAADHQHAGIDPHVWTSPKNAVIIVGNISRALAALDPVNAAYYSRNAADVIAELTAVYDEIGEMMRPLTRRSFLVFHPAWAYFARDFGLEERAIEHGGKTITPKYLAEIIAEAKEHQVRVVFVSPQFDRKSAAVIAAQIKGIVVVVDPLSREYTENMRRVAAAIVEAQGK